MMHESRLGVAFGRSGKSVCARRIYLCLEQAEETVGIGWSIIVTACTSQSQRSWAATGRDAVLCRGLRAPPRCSTEPFGLKSNRDSAHCWMTSGAQTRGSKVNDPALQQGGIAANGDRRA